ncbi:hypothetical protein Clacol_002930 [Clathrus columnatus]|uniref:Uncharacterized protein n=1 Tax=Clathrus columnatus TaxID=1419009 RepID=A0AAV5A6S9_9AGAM|nr:hypothetical protein Clacol_002930 [Clathrus columnatus]
MFASGNSEENGPQSLQGYFYMIIKILPNIAYRDAGYDDGIPLFSTELSALKQKLLRLCIRLSDTKEIQSFVQFSILLNAERPVFSLLHHPQMKVIKHDGMKPRKFGKPLKKLELEK